MRNPRIAGNHNNPLPPGVYLLEQNFAAYAESGTQHTERQTLAMIFPQVTVQGAAIIPRWQKYLFCHHENSTAAYQEIVATAEPPDALLPILTEAYKVKVPPVT